MPTPTEPERSPSPAAATPSDPSGDPGTAGPGHIGVRSTTPENQKGHINPSAPNDGNVTPGSVEKK